MPNLENFIKNKRNITFLISRIDSIGDVILTLPIANYLKKVFPFSRIIFLGKTYTEAVVTSCKSIDYFLNWDTINKLQEREQISVFSNEKIDVFIHVFPNPTIAKIAKKAHIPFRIATSHRLYNLLYCNKLINLSRKNSPLHESQLNIKLIECLGVKKDISLEEIRAIQTFEANLIDTPTDYLLDSKRFNLILHPKSKGSAREWGVDNFNELIRILPKDMYNIFISGTKEEGDLIREGLINNNPHVNDITGKLTLEEFISFISKSDCLIAASTGPLHIAASCNIHAIGLYPPIRPMHPERWKPIGNKVKVFCKDKECEACRKSSDCQCIRDITPDMIKIYLETINKSTDL